MAVKGRKTSSKNPPILSHEFVIQNHADIVSCVAMLFVVGLMFQATQPLASIFIAMHHNVTGSEPVPYGTEIFYTSGWKDVCAVFFYTLIAIVVHAVIQEYVLDKIKTKLHLSKVKQSKFNESGQLLIFYVVSVLWGGDIIFREGLLFKLSGLWDGYPNVPMTFMFKFFFIIQLAYWLHCYPELYFQKAKREEIPSRVINATIYFAIVFLSYFTNFTRLSLYLLTLHYLSESVFHTARMLHFAEKASVASQAFKVWNVVFVIARLSSVILSVLTFWYGLPLVEAQNESAGLNISEGNFNIAAVRLIGLLTACALQGYMMFRFVSFHLGRYRERVAASPSSSAAKKAKQNKARKTKEGQKKSSEEEISELPEVDQNTKNVRQRNTQKTK